LLRVAVAQLTMLKPREFWRYRQMEIRMIRKYSVLVGLTVICLLTVSTCLAEELNVDAQQATPTQQRPPAPPPEQQKQRKIEGSMVGYIDNAIIGSHVRMRIESAWHAQHPDRAEFFYAKCGCYRGLAGSPAFDPNAPGPRPGVITDLNYQQLYFEGEYAPISRVSAFAEVPIRWLRPQSFVPGTGSFGNQAGLSDVRAGVKVGVLNKESSALTVQFKGYFPTGDASQGLGVNHGSIEPAVLFYQKAGRFAVESQFSYWHPTSSSAGVATASNPNPPDFAGNVVSYGIGPSFEVYSGDRVRLAPVVELVGWRILDGFQTVISGNNDVSGTNIVNLKMGARAVIRGRSSIYAGYGRGLTTAVWYQDLLRVEYRFAF
jgi:hypothetical protein